MPALSPSTEGSQWIKFSMDKTGVKDFNMAKIRITQTRSRIGSTARQKRTLDALGLRRTQKSIELEASPQILGMVNKVKHLLKIEDV